MKKLLLFLLLAGIAAVIVWGVLRKSDPPKVRFARVVRQTLVSTLPTNGKVEPAVWQAVRAETGGVVSRAPVEDGQAVAAGAVLAEITDPTLQAEIDAAQAKLNEARANLASQEAGGKPAEFTDIDNSLARAQLNLVEEQKILASLQRLVAQHAATQQEADLAREMSFGDIPMELRVFLKICEICGCLWYRTQIETRVYCSSCNEKLKDFPTPQSRRRRGRPRKVTLPTVFAVASSRGVQNRSTGSDAPIRSLGGQNDWSVSVPDHTPDARTPDTQQFETWDSPLAHLASRSSRYSIAFLAGGAQ